MKPHQIIRLMTYEGTDNTLVAARPRRPHPRRLPPAVRLERQARPPAPSAVLKPGQWIKLIDRLGEIDNPMVRVKPSKYSITVEPPKRASGAALGRVAPALPPPLPRAPRRAGPSSGHLALRPNVHSTRNGGRRRLGVARAGGVARISTCSRPERPSGGSPRRPALAGVERRARAGRRATRRACRQPRRGSRRAARVAARAAPLTRRQAKVAQTRASPAMSGPSRPSRAGLIAAEGDDLPAPSRDRSPTPASAPSAARASPGRPCRRVGSQPGAGEDAVGRSSAARFTPPASASCGRAGRTVQAHGPTIASRRWPHACSASPNWKFRGPSVRADGRYVVRRHAGETPEHVLVLATLGAPQRRLRGGKRARATDPEPEPTAVATGRATVIRRHRAAQRGRGRPLAEGRRRRGGARRRAGRAQPRPARPSRRHRRPPRPGGRPRRRHRRPRRLRRRRAGRRGPLERGAHAARPQGRPPAPERRPAPPGARRRAAERPRRHAGLRAARAPGPDRPRRRPPARGRPAARVALRRPPWPSCRRGRARRPRPPGSTSSAANGRRSPPSRPARSNAASTRARPARSSGSSAGWRPPCGPAAPPASSDPARRRRAARPTAPPAPPRARRRRRRRACTAARASHGVGPGGDDRHLAAGLARDARQLRDRVDLQRRADAQQQVGAGGQRVGALQRPLGQELAEEHHVGLERLTAVARGNGDRRVLQAQRGPPRAGRPRHRSGTRRCRSCRAPRRARAARRAGAGGRCSG